MAEVDQFLIHYGYAAIFGLLMLGIVGPLIPDETILVLTGIFIHRGQLQFIPAAATAVAGSLCGITLSYAIGLYGFEWLTRRWPRFRRFADQHLAQAEKWFARFGKWTLFLGYFIAGVRHFTALFAGISRMNYREFAPPAYCGALFWVLTFISIGYFVGEQWSKYEGTAHVVVIVAALVAVAAVFVWRWRSRSQLNSRR